MTGLRRHMALALALLVAVVPCMAAGKSALEAVCRMVDGGSGDPLEGVWRIAGGGAVFAVVPKEGDAGRFSLVIVDSPDMSVLPMTVFGEAVPTAVPGKYDASVTASMKSGAPSSRRHNLVMTLT